ncbi:pyruvate formate-lyase-activating protein [Corynebacterium tapiri]|uniref:Pyruvate formate-lyase-activating enzyme n=1 Tax=Corynebacterium tapiri TaxID=1448266 RepID=A0A5C4U1H6_9CORY|nr:pyruvate formate-lyase-activating protein [Corynebacterium tapiri]TNL94862.1 pyruvate formate lyase-activating protein [Corynebacterium tapiri]
MTVPSIGVSDGTTGPFRPKPVDIPTPKLRGAASGIAGAEDLSPLERAEKFEEVREGIAGSIHSWELVTSVDGPGTRMTLFLSGCPLRCVYCHNPDTLHMKDGTLQSLDDIVKKMKRYRPVFKASGGGITISGGEPLFQEPFTRNLLREAKKLGIHTAIDTSGFLGARVDEEMMQDIDLFLLDIKSGDPETYKKVTGRELQPTIDFGNRLNENHRKVWIRFVVVPGWTDDWDNVEKAADIVGGWKNAVERVEVLPFHNMAQDKWESLGMKYYLENVKPPEAEVVERIREQFRARGLDVY